MNINYEPLLKVSTLENQTDTCMKAELQTGKNETVDQNPYLLPLLIPNHTRT